MSLPFENQENTGILTIAGLPNIGRTSIGVQQNGETHRLHMVNTAIPAIAAELLMAAGHYYFAELIDSNMKTDATKKLQERRDALAAQFSKAPLLYSQMSSTTQDAINAYIELEDATSRA